MGFGEVGLILLVALVVLGPERLPEVARHLGKTWAKLKYYRERLTADFDGQLQLNDLQQKRAQAAAAEMKHETDDAS